MRRIRSSEASPLPARFNAPNTSAVNVTFAALIACAGATALGYHLAATNGVLDQIIFEMGVGGKWSVVAIVQGLMVGLHLAGIALGSLSGESLSESIGLRQTLLLIAQPLVLAPLICMQAPLVEHWDGITNKFDGRPFRVAIMLLSRLILGAASGVVATVVPLYIQEVAPSSTRGMLAGLSQLSICVGIVLALLTNAVLPASLWRAGLFVGEVPAITLALGMLLCPESPSWLIRKGRRADADAAAQWLWGPNASPETCTPGTTVHSSPQPAMRDAFTGSPAWPRLGELQTTLRRTLDTALLLIPYQPLVGLHPLIYFSTMLFRQAGVAGSRRLTTFIGLANLLGTLLAAFSKGSSHKAILANCWLGQSLAMFLIAFASGSSELALVAGSLFCALSFGFGAGPVNLLTKPDPVAGAVKGPAVTLGAVSHWLYHIALGTAFPLLLEMLSLPVLWSLLGAAALLEAIYCWSLSLGTRVKNTDKV